MWLLSYMYLFCWKGKFYVNYLVDFATTGQVLPLKNMQQVIQFCKEEGLVLLADEVREHQSIS